MEWNRTWSGRVFAAAASLLQCCHALGVVDQCHQSSVSSPSYCRRHLGGAQVLLLETHYITALLKIAVYTVLLYIHTLPGYI